jgi:hypothetical protein
MVHADSAAALHTRTQMNTLHARPLTWAAVTLTALFGLALTHLSAASVDVLRFNIDADEEAAPLHTGDTVFDDGLDDSASWEYADYRISAQTGVPVCVESAIQTAFSFIRLNRVLDASGEAGVRCGDAGGAARNWYAVVKGNDACSRLVDYDREGRVETWVDTDNVTKCRLSGFDSPRMRVENLFARRVPAETNIALLISSFNALDGHGGYEIRTQTKGSVRGTATARVVDYHGTAQLWEFIGKAKPVAESFPFNVHLTVEKVTLP